MAKLTSRNIKLIIQNGIFLYFSKISVPTLLQKDGFKFFFYANEHEPKHIHVMKGDEFAKIELLGLYVAKNYMKPKDLKKALIIVEAHKDKFERQWDEYFSQR